MVERISRRDETRLASALRDALSCRGDPSQLLAKSAADHGISDQMVPLLCHNYNKTRTVDHITKAPMEKRAEAFPLACPDVVLGLLHKSGGGDAGIPAPLKFDDYSRMDFDDRPVPLYKAASWGRPKEYETMDELDGNRMQKRLHGSVGVLADIRSAAGQADQMAKEAALRFAKEFAELEPVAAREAAGIISTHYGPDGERLVKYAAVRTGLSLDSLPSRVAALPPKGRIYKMAADALAAADARMTALERAVAVADGFEKSAAYPIISALAGGIMGGGAMGGFGNMLSAASDSVAGYAGTTADRVTTQSELLANIVSDMGKSPKTEKVFGDPSLDAAVRSHDLRQSFIYALGDQAVAKYPADKAAEAFSVVVNTRPSLADPRMRPYLAAAMAELLGRDNRVDPATMASEVSTERYMSDAESKRGDLAASARIDPSDTLDKEPLKVKPIAEGSTNLQSLSSLLKGFTEPVMKSVGDSMKGKDPGKDKNKGKGSSK
jgi:hypothetical protein